MEIVEKTPHCPYCGELITLLIDPSSENQDYIEDCEVCCRPIRIGVLVSLDGSIQLSLASDSE